jgi:hypothetical protein
VIKSIASFSASTTSPAFRFQIVDTAFSSSTGIAIGYGHRRSFIVAHGVAASSSVVSSTSTVRGVTIFAMTATVLSVIPMAHQARRV